MRSQLNTTVLERQNVEFAGTGGRSQENQEHGFHPAFMDVMTRVVYRSRFADGRLAPFHLLDGLPDEVVASRDACGHVALAKTSIVAGFIRDGHFYSREEAAELAAPACA